MNKCNVVAVEDLSLTGLCKRIEAYINDGGYDWDGRWQKNATTYQAILFKRGKNEYSD